MTDEEIISLYFDRSEEAIAATQRKYDGYCRRNGSVAALAGGDRDLRNIDKHKSVLPSKSFHDYIQLNSRSQ
ncbi:MAG: hypothetical protein IIV27_02870 [Clostridia bacterium]|nr:hypothetical protein [Clostridia bacterium]